jgi:hypothetical protein
VQDVAAGQQDRLSQMESSIARVLEQRNAQLAVVRSEVAGCSVADVWFRLPDP